MVAQFTVSASGSLAGRHPLGTLRAVATTEGLALELGIDRSADLSLRLDAWGRAGNETRVDRLAPAVRDGVATYAHPGMDEWYLLAAAGLEHGFTVHDRPAGSGSLVFVMGMSGLSPAADGEGFALLDAQGRERARYGSLLAFDATGRELPSHMSAEGTRITIRVDDTGATYPIVVDPLVTTETVLVPPPAERVVNGQVGYDVDVDGDTLVLGTSAARPLVYVRGTTGWALQHAIPRPMGSSSRFGNAVAISGDTIAIGDWGIDSVFVYVRSGTTWTLEQQITRTGGSCAPRFGLSVDLDADVLVSGGHTGCSAPTVGGAYAYRRSGTTWSLDGTLVPGAPSTPSHVYGGSVAIDGDTIAVTDHPGAFVWVRAAGVWVMQQELTHGGQLALDGDTLVAGGTLATTGIRIFQRTSGAWSVEHSISVSTYNAVAISGDRLFNADGSYLTGHLRRGTAWTVVYPRTSHPSASAVAISGDYVVAGTPTVDGGGVSNAGSALVLDWVGLDVGDACAAASECASGFCVDGVCCNSACGSGSTMDCQACAAAAGGAASDGTCGPLSASGASAVTCRASTGGCDPAETCSPLSIACPTDQLAAAGTTCRPSAGGCDVAEVCAGSVAACPADAFAAAGTECRASAGACDVAEACDGAGSACPADAFASSGTECRAAVDVCDVADTCDGATAACPPDALAAAGTPCRAAAGVCDAAEACDGSSPSCPIDQALADGTSCANETICDGDELCASGACVAGMALVCDDGDDCTADACADPDGCTHTPIAGMTGCCTGDAYCDDGDDCTTDRCETDGSCSHAAACMADAGTTGDAGTIADAGRTEEDASLLDGASPGHDAGTPIAPTVDDGGCGCRVPAGPRHSPAPAAWVGLLLLALLRRRRRRR